MIVRAGELRQHSTWEQMLVPLVPGLCRRTISESPWETIIPGQRTVWPSP
jgi:hypothetical protein